MRSWVRFALAAAFACGAMAVACKAQTNAFAGLFLGYSSAIDTLALAPNGRQAVTGGQDNVLRLWDLPTGLLLRTIDVQANRIAAAAFSPNGQQILTGGGTVLRLWSVTSGRLVETMEGHTGEVLAVAFAPDGMRAVSGSADKTIKLWDLQTGGLVRSFEGHAGEVTSAAFSPDGKTLLSASRDRTLKLWDSDTGEMIKTLEGHAEALTAALFLPDGKRALSASADKTIRLWDLLTGRLLNTFEGHSDAVSSLALAPGGHRFLSASKDKTLKLWDLDAHQSVATFEGHADSVTSVALSTDGTSALSGSFDKTLKLWDLASGSLLKTIDLKSPDFWPNGYRDFFAGAALAKSADPAEVEDRLAKNGLKRGAPVFLRIFKGDRQVELWIKRAERYALFAVYPICAWSGQLGPKEREGDLQAPEGFYSIAKAQLNPNSRYHRAFNLGYPNAFDRAQSRTGANLMMHGGCGSVGCYAMTDAAIDELWLLVTAALDAGQERVPVHVFPFRMTEARMDAFSWHPSADFWRDLKPAFDLFEQNRVPPKISIVNKRYDVEGRSRDGWTPVSANKVDPLR